MNIKNNFITAAIILGTLANGACTNDSEIPVPTDPSARSVNFSVSDLPGYQLTDSATIASNDSSDDSPIETRTSITTSGTNAGKITWALNDVIYIGIRFRNAANTVISSANFNIAYKKKSEGSGNEWVVSQLINWPATATRADLTATYIGDAQPGEWSLDDEVYVHTSTGLQPSETFNLNNFKHRLNIHSFSTLKAGDVVTMKDKDLKQYRLDPEDYFTLTLRQVGELSVTVPAGKTTTRIVTSSFSPQNTTFSIERNGSFIVKDKKMGLQNSNSNPNAQSGYYYTFKLTTPTQGPKTPDTIGQ